MKKLAMMALTLASTAAIPAAASAAPADFDGTYALTCEAGSYTLHFDLAGNLDGNPVSFHPADLEIPIPCEAGDPEAAALLAEVEQRCLTAGLGTLCDDVVGAVAGAIEGTSALIPRQITTEVTNADHWFAKLTRIFTMRVEHVFDDGAVRSGTYLISDGNATNGDFLSVAAGIDGAAFGGGAGCVATTLGKVEGNIDRGAGFALTAALELDGSLACGFVHGGDWLAGAIGLTFHADVSGARAEP